MVWVRPIVKSRDLPTRRAVYDGLTVIQRTERVIIDPIRPMPDALPARALR